MTITYKQYLIFMLLITSLLIVIVASINYKIDPAMIYHDIDELNDNSATAFVHKLVKSPNGLLLPNNSWNARDIKSALAKDDSIRADCAVIGSSHVMQISSFRSNASLDNICPVIINLGVSGGTLEDYLALSYMLINKINKPKTIVFGIDPWAMNFYRDVRWERYEESYYLMSSLLVNNDLLETDSNKFKYIVNLLNPQYFSRSLQTIGKKNIKINEAPGFNLSQGFKDPVILPDGSHVYSKKYIFDANASKIPIGGSIYKIKDNSQYSESAISLFQKLVGFMRDKNINVIFLMTPYHHNVWQDKKSKTTQALLEMEPLIRHLGKELNVNVLGSFSPYKIGCDFDEFYDYMHAKDSCLAKIKN